MRVQSTASCPGAGAARSCHGTLRRASYTASTRRAAILGLTLVLGTAEARVLPPSLLLPWGSPLRMRGGSSPSSSPSYENSYDPATSDYPPQQHQPQQSPPAASYYENLPATSTLDDGSSGEDPFHETVQQRVDNWKTTQREQAESMMQSPRDAQGRVKMLTSVSKGSRAIIFFFLMWRDVHLYEVADQVTKGLGRLLLVTPLCLLFVANMAGAVASLTSPSHSAKRRLKAILNCDKLVEALLILFSFMRLTVFPSKHVPREIYIANVLHSFVFILQCQAFTRLSWDENAAQPMHSYVQQPQQYAPTEPQQLGDEDAWENPSRSTPFP